MTFRVATAPAWRGALILRLVGFAPRPRAGPLYPNIEATIVFFNDQKACFDTNFRVDFFA